MSPTMLLRQSRSVLCRVSASHAKSLSALALAGLKSYYSSSSSSSSSSSQSSTFEQATELQGSANANAYVAAVTDKYSIGGVPNGGYLAGICTRAAQATFGGAYANVVSVSGPFHAAVAEASPADVTTEVLHAGRSSASALVRVQQNDDLKCTFIVQMGDYSRMRGIAVHHLQPPQLAPLEHCINASEAIQKDFRGMFRVADEVEFRVPPASAFAVTTMAHKPDLEADCSIAGYMRFTDGGMPNLEFFCDAAPPPTLNAATTHWVPTLEYSVHMWADPQIEYAAKGPDERWVRFNFSSKYVHDGLVSTDGELWTDEEHPKLLARSRQLARHLLPKKN